LLRALAPQLLHNAAAKHSDDEILADIKARMAKQSWAPKSGIHVSVKDAVVDLGGVIMSDDEHRAVKVIAENAAGVAAVNDHLVFVDPGSGMAFPAGGV
jgi:osmotically-inducible protein OsmY